MTTTFKIETSRGDFTMRDTSDEIALYGHRTTAEKISVFGDRLARKMGGSAYHVSWSDGFGGTVEFAYGRKRDGVLAVDGRCTVYAVREA